MRAEPLPPLARFSLACVALLCSLPFLQPYHLYPLTSFYTEWLAFGLGIGVATVLLQRRIWEQVEVPWAVLSPFALAALLMVHGALGWSPYFGHALLGALYLIWAGILIVATRTLVHTCGTDTVFSVVAVGFVVGASLSAMIGIIQHFNLMTPFNAFIVRLNGPSIFGNLAQPNHFGAYTALGLFSIAYLYGRGRMVLASAAVCALPLLFVLGLSGSRSVWLYLFTAFGFAAWLRGASSKDEEGRRLFIACGALIIIYFVLQLMVDAGWFKPIGREAVTSVERLFSGAQSVSDRVGLWGAAWSMAMDHPVLGVGWGAFSSQYFDLISAADTNAPLGIFNNAHNILLHLFAETGVIGVVLLLIPLMFWLADAWRAERDARQWWLFATIGVLAIHSMLEYPLWYAYFLGIAAVLLGLAPTRGFMPQLARLGRLFAVTVLCISAANLVFIWTDYREYERLVHGSPDQMRGVDVNETMKRLHRNFLLTPYLELTSVVVLPVAEKNLSLRLTLNERVIRFTPQPLFVYRQVLLLALAERLPEAQELLARLQHAYPDVPPEFERELAQGLREHPDRFRPLLESVSRRAGARN